MKTVDLNAWNILRKSKRSYRMGINEHVQTEDKVEGNNEGWNRILWCWSVDYCYYCGKTEKACDKDNPSGNLYSHFVNWQENENTAKI